MDEIDPKTLLARVQACETVMGDCVLLVGKDAFREYGACLDELERYRGRDPYLNTAIQNATYLFNSSKRSLFFPSVFLKSLLPLFFGIAAILSGAATSSGYALSWLYWVIFFLGLAGLFASRMPRYQVNEKIINQGRLRPRVGFFAAIYALLAR